MVIFGDATHESVAIVTERPMGGLTPTQYARQLAVKAVTMPHPSKALRY
jgi:hypothetical protein